MPSWLTDLLQAIGLTTPAVYALAVIRASRWIEGSASDNAKIAISNWVQSKQFDKQAVGDATIEMFDRVYTRRLFSWKAFARSALFTLSVTVIFLFEVYSGQDSDTYLLFNPPDFETFREELASFGTSIIPNIVSDYVSLFAVRRLLVSAKNRPLFAFWIGPLVGISIIGLFNLVINDALLAQLFFWWGTGRDYPSVFYDVVVYNFKVPEWRALLAAACIVHLWLPLFAVSAGLLRAIGWMQWFLKDGRQRPYEVIGYLSAALVFAGTFALKKV